MDISVVVPIYNEEENIPRMYEELRTVLEGLGKSYEMVLVDDGSTDRSLALLKEIQQQDSHVVVVALRRNFGQTAAMVAGFDHAKGEIIITMDGDMQNDPHDIPKLIDKMNEGFDVVTGWRYKRQDPFLSRRLPSLIANRLISWITGVRLHDYGCTLKAFRREVTENLRFTERCTVLFLPLPLAWASPLLEVRVKPPGPGVLGSSKYGISPNHPG